MRTNFEVNQGPHLHFLCYFSLLPSRRL